MTKCPQELYESGKEDWWGRTEGEERCAQGCVVHQQLTSLHEAKLMWTIAVNAGVEARIGRLGRGVGRLNRRLLCQRAPDGLPPQAEWGRPVDACLSGFLAFFRPRA